MGIQLLSHTLIAKKFGRVISEKNSDTKVNLRLENTNWKEATSVKMLVLLQPQGFRDTPRRHKFCQAVTYLKHYLDKSSLQKGN